MGWRKETQRPKQERGRGSEDEAESEGLNRAGSGSTWYLIHPVEQQEALEGLSAGENLFRCALQPIQVDNKVKMETRDWKARWEAVSSGLLIPRWECRVIKLLKGLQGWMGIHPRPPIPHLLFLNAG